MFNALQLFKSLSINEKGEAIVNSWENAKRKTVLVKLPQAIHIFNELIQLYAATQMLKCIEANKIKDFAGLKKYLSASAARKKWSNIGGQLILDECMKGLKEKITSGKIKSWDEVHAFYQQQGKSYDTDNLQHAYASLLELWDLTHKDFTPALFKKLMQEMLATKSWMTQNIRSTREKDYTNPFRKMVYDNNKEMLAVIGKMEDNTFIQAQEASYQSLNRSVNGIIKKWKL
jgi:hypothetical protein